MTSPFQRIYETVIAKAPQLAPKNTHAIREWIATGYDLEKDILPAIDEAMKRGTASIYSFSFFTPGIQRMNEKRIKSNSNVKFTESETDLMRAKRIKWHRVRCIASQRVGPQDFSWLDQYEQQNGEVQL